MGSQINVAQNITQKKSLQELKNNSDIMKFFRPTEDVDIFSKSNSADFNKMIIELAKELGIDYILSDISENTFTVG